MSHRLVVTMLAWLGLAGSALAQGPANVMLNGSFEEGINGWQPSVHDPKHVGAAVAIDQTQAKAGARSVKTSLPGQSNAAITSPLAPVRAGQDYLLTFWYRSEGFSETSLYAGVNLQYVLTWLDADNKPVSTGGMGLSYGAVPEWRFSTAAFKRAGAYQDIPVRFVLPPGVQWIDPRLIWNGGVATWIDTIMIVEEKVFAPEDIKTLMSYSREAYTVFKSGRAYENPAGHWPVVRDRRNGKAC